jgi:hypothetical protein
MLVIKRWDFMAISPWKYSDNPFSWNVVDDDRNAHGRIPDRNRPQTGRDLHVLFDNCAAEVHRFSFDPPDVLRHY